MPTRFKDCFLELLSKWLAKTICTNHTPANRINKPVPMQMATTRNRVSSRFSSVNRNVIRAPV